MRLGKLKKAYLGVVAVVVLLAHSGTASAELINLMMGKPDISATVTSAIYDADYGPSTGLLTITGTPKLYTTKTDPTPFNIKTPRSFTIQALINPATGDLQSGTLTVSGGVDLNRDNLINLGEPSGTLLTGNMVGFGFIEPSVPGTLISPFFEFGFFVNGGALASDYGVWAAAKLSVTRNFGYDGSFTHDFSGLGGQANIAAPIPAALPAGLALIGGTGLLKWWRRAKQA